MWVLCVYCALCAGARTSLARSPSIPAEFVSVDTLPAQKYVLASDGACRMPVNMPSSMQHVCGMLQHAHGIISMRPGMCSASLRRFPAPPVSAVLRKAKLQTPAGAVEAPRHARILFHAIFDAHAACHAARAHVKRTRGRSVPRACAGTLCCMPHAMQKVCLAGARDPISVPMHAARLRRVLT